MKVVTFNLILCVIVFCSKAFALEVEVRKEDGFTWSGAEEKLVQKAAEITFKRIAKYNVATCAYRNIFRGPNKDQVRERWGRQIPFLNKSKKVVLTIQKKELDGNRLGQALVGIAEIDKRNYEFFNLRVSIDNEQFSKDAEKFAKNSGSDSQVNRWVQVIAHELAHNLGYNHGSKGSTWEEKYPGYFITELGYCVMSDGKYGSDMGDQVKWRHWEKMYGDKK